MCQAVFDADSSSSKHRRPLSQRAHIPQLRFLSRMADKTTPPKEPLAPALPLSFPHGTTPKSPATCRPRRSSIIEQLNQIAANYDAQINALDNLPETRNLRLPEEDFTTVRGQELVIDRSINPLAEFDHDDDDVAADPFTEEAASAFLRQAEILKLQADLKREAGGGK